MEMIPAEGALRWFYETRLGRRMSTPIFALHVISRAVGWWQQRRWSTRHIEAFAARFGVDLREVEVPSGGFASFNDFFTRRLRPGARSFSQEAHVLCAPADGRALVFPRLDETADFPVKGAQVRPDTLLGGADRAKAYHGGSAMVVRLAPADYHRFHFCDDAEAEPTHRIPGRLHSVNPIALHRIPQLLAANQRSATLLRSARFGAIMQVEVGAFAVGSIVQTFRPGPVRRGQEKGFFQFGGSSVVLLFEPETVAFDEDLVQDSRTGLEVRIRAGEQVGRRASGR